MSVNVQLKNQKSFPQILLRNKALFMVEGKSKQANSHSWPLGNIHDGEESFSI